MRTFKQELKVELRRRENRRSKETDAWGTVYATLGQLLLLTTSAKIHATIVDADF